MRNTKYKTNIYWRKKYKEDPEKVRKYQRECYKKHREKRLAQKKEYYKKIILQKKEYYKRKKEKEFKAYLSLMKYERSESRMEKKRINQRAYVQRKKLNESSTDISR